MKRKTKKKPGIWEPKVNFVADEKLNALKAKDLAPEKLAIANVHLKRMRSLPK